VSRSKENGKQEMESQKLETGECRSWVENHSAIAGFLFFISGFRFSILFRGIA